MSAPDTNVEKQRKRHWPPLLAFAVIAVFIGFITFVAISSDGVPLDEQAASDTAPTETTNGPAVTIETD